MIALAVDLCNSVAVTLFGIALSAAFCNIHWTPKAKKRMLLYTLMIFCLSGIAYLGVDPGFGRYLYPLHTDLPLVLALCSLSHERLWPVISVLTAYLCCQAAALAGADRGRYLLRRRHHAARCGNNRHRAAAHSAAQGRTCHPVGVAVFAGGAVSVRHCARGVLCV